MFCGVSIVQCGFNFCITSFFDCTCQQYQESQMTEKGILFVYVFIDKWYPFRTPNFQLLQVHCLKNMNKSLIQ